MPEGGSAFTASRRRRSLARRNIPPPKSDHLVDAELAGRDESGFKAGVQFSLATRYSRLRVHHIARETAASVHLRYI